MANTVVFITGAGRGLGRALVETYLQRPNHTVIGTVRDSTSSAYDDLKNSPTASGSKLILLSLDCSRLEDPAKAIEAASNAGISHIDLLIANAAIASAGEPQSLALKDVVDVLNVNVISPIALFQAAKPLLDKSAKPIWISVSSIAGSIASIKEQKFTQFLPYSMSKTALNNFTVTLHGAEPHLIAYAIHPGFVQTDMGNAGAKKMGLEKAPNTVEESIAAIVASADKATREETSGKYLDVISGQELPW
ncbi:NAD(P)-binding protein [Westerdykella ornata]|uniref:NAD(P)-binding protein n=1 Tax=Westerdykella ornata TaxID=318751 RepID=A0A6A6JUA2_WESOR|nr:NAD(P)-binding protein [Westerdykella ornata]KAF2279408.1 NAD(P)-binding protein [Westerdykella ornata]